MVSRRESKEVTREKVLAAANGLFATRGYRATTVRDIAARADVSVGSVMAVGDKPTLLVAAFDEAIAAIHQERVTRGSQASGEGSGADRVVQLVDPFLTLFADKVDLAREYAAILMSGSHNSVLFGELSDALRAEMAQEARAAGVAEASIDVAAKASYFAYLGTLFFWAARGATTGTEPRDDFTSILDYLLTSRK